MSKGDLPRPLKERAQLRAYGIAQRALAGREPSKKVLEQAGAEWEAPPLTVTCIYRVANQALVQRLLADVAGSADIRLWTLDTIAPELAHWTLGSGPGGRFELHERLLGAKRVDTASTWIVADDDVDLGTSSLAMLAKLAFRARFDVYGPVHGPRSNFSHVINMRRPFLVARECDFVEVGPIIGFSPTARAKLLPFHDSSGLGWGMEAVWAAARHQGLRLGLVDAQPVRHLGTVGSAYDKSRERIRNTNLLTEHGYASRSDLFRVRRRWWSWQSAPRWSA